MTYLSPFGSTYPYWTIDTHRDDNGNFIVPSTVTITPQQVDDLLAAALEGGINHWCSNAGLYSAHVDTSSIEHISDGLTRGCFIILHLQDSDDVRDLTIEKMLQGISMAAEHFKTDVSNFLEDHDAESADIAVQFAVFGTIVY